MSAYACSRCNGVGRLPVFSNVLGGVCFKCKGSKVQASMPKPRAIRWAVFGTDRHTGACVRLYNVTARTEGGAVERARRLMLNASPEFKEQYSLAVAIAMHASKADQTTMH